MYFEKITKDSKKQADILYTLLLKREFNISHVQKISKNKHINFIKNHPYRAWYLIKDDSGEYLGSVYLTRNNSIGINLINYLQATVIDIMKFIQDNYQPLKELPSSRPSYFYVNVSPKNKRLIKILKSLKKIHIQETYKI